MGVVTNLLILISVLSALPWLRNNFHNIFERHHRFIGWFVDFIHFVVILCLTNGLQAWIDIHLGLCTNIFLSHSSLKPLTVCWIQVILSDSYDPALGRWDPSGKRIIGDQQFWFAIGMTTLCVSKISDTKCLDSRHPTASSYHGSLFEKCQLTSNSYAPPLSLLVGIPTKIIVAVAKGRHYSVRAWHAARPTRSYKSIFNYGIPRLRYHQVKSTSSAGIFPALTFSTVKGSTPNTIT